MSNKSKMVASLLLASLFSSMAHAEKIGQIMCVIGDSKSGITVAKSVIDIEAADGRNFGSATGQVSYQGITCTGVGHRDESENSLTRLTVTVNGVSFSNLELNRKNALIEISENGQKSFSCGCAVFKAK